MKRKVLVIDDDRSIVEVVKSSLVKRGYDVFTAGNGQDGLEQIKADTPDLILLDVVMPKMNGYEFLRALKAHRNIEGEPMIPVIIVTAKDEMEDLFKFEGVTDFLVKPADPNDLIEKIEEFLGKTA